MKEAVVSSIPLSFTLLSPIHIGSQKQQLERDLEFILDNGKCYVVDDKKLLAEVARRNQLDKFIADSGSSDFKLSEFLGISSLQENRRKELLTSISSYSCSCKVGVGRSIRPFIRNAHAQPYIPGGALKGAFRTAILYCWLKERKKDTTFWNREIISKLKTRLDAPEPRDPEQKRRQLGDFIEEFLQHFDLYYEYEGLQRKVEKAEPQQTDLLRSLRIPDFPPMDKDSLEIKEVRVISLTSGNTCKFSRKRKGDTNLPVRIQPELLMSGKLNFELQIDVELWDRFRSNKTWSSIKELVERKGEQKAPGAVQGDRGKKLLLGLLSCCQEFAEDVFRYEKDLFARLRPDPAQPDLDLRTLQDFYAQLGRKAPNLRIGWGSGMRAAGIFGLIEDKDIIERVARLFLHYQRGKLPYGRLQDGDSIFELFPKTRRVVMRGGIPAATMGWARLEVV